MDQATFAKRLPLLCKQLKQLLEKDLLDLEQLEKTLTEESKALSERKSDAISAYAELKSNLVDQIRQRAKAKARLLATSGAEIHPGEVRKGIEQFNDPELCELWDTSLERLKQCKEQNLVNGLVIQRSKQRTEKLMDLVRGKPQKQNLYGAQGSSQSISGSNRIAEA
jgi:flagella synthesis protein FlgN